MSFSSDVKQELAAIEIFSACCSRAQVYGLVLFARFSSGEISITTENTTVLNLYIQSVRAICGAEPIISSNTTKKLLAVLEGAENRNAVYDYFGHGTRDATLRINRSNLAEDCCYAAFLRGAFLACGTVTNPNKGYHLEFVVSHKRLCLDMIKLMQEMELNPKYILRKGNHIIYFKDSESIEDILTVMGATNSSLEFMGIKMEKDMKNSVNRKLNFEMSNLTKTIDAAALQVDAIKKIEQKSGLSSLPEKLSEIARLRLDNPDVSLTELGKMLSEPISRSGVNHRLQRLIEIADKL